jgi:cytosine deaminase
MNRSSCTPYFQELERRIAGLGGMFNAHLHLDRTGTYHETVEMLSARGVEDGASLSLAGKHALIPMVHASKLYEQANLTERTAGYLERMIGVGTTRAETVVDTTLDMVGTNALDTFLRIKQQFANRIDFRCGAYSPLGFRDDEPQRWELLVEGAKRADFLGLLPERDDQETYPEHIGYKESCRRAIELTRKLGKTIHIHVDQANHEYENGSETVVEVVRELGAGVPAGQDPFIWLIHVISPSTYPEPRFESLAADLAELNIGVITCPSAALSMRQYRKLRSPTFNSIARVLELLVAGVHVRVGSDNICDITSPMGTPDLMDEIFVLANAVRYYEIDIFAKLAAGLRLDESERERIRIHLAENDKVVDAVAARYQNRTN